MGLDNGLVVHNIKKEDIPSFVRLPFTPTASKENDIDICYWRKCWGIRNYINATLHLPPDMYGCVVDREDIPTILEDIRYFMRPKNWEDGGDSIWSYDEIIDTLVSQYINLSWFYEYWKDHPEVTLTWYDSY